MKKLSNGSRQAPVAVFVDNVGFLQQLRRGLTWVLRGPKLADKLPLEVNHVGLPQQAD